MARQQHTSINDPIKYEFSANRLIETLKKQKQIKRQTYRVCQKYYLMLKFRHSYTNSCKIIISHLIENVTEISSRTFFLKVHLMAAILRNYDGKLFLVRSVDQEQIKRFVHRYPAIQIVILLSVICFAEI